MRRFRDTATHYGKPLIIGGYLFVAVLAYGAFPNEFVAGAQVGAIMRGAVTVVKIIIG